MRLKKTIVFGIITVLTVFISALLPFSAFATQTSSITIDNAFVTIGEQFEFKVKMTHNGHGVSVNIVYDSSRLTYVPNSFTLLNTYITENDVGVTVTDGLISFVALKDNINITNEAVFSVKFIANTAGFTVVRAQANINGFLDANYLPVSGVTYDTAVVSASASSTASSNNINSNIVGTENIVQIPQNGIQSAVSGISSVNISADTSILYDNKYFEGIIRPGETMTVPVTITNTGTTSVEIAPYFVKYSASGDLINFEQCSTIIVPANQAVSTTLSAEFESSVSYTAKIFFWQKNTVKPITQSISLSTVGEDFYSDTYTDATKHDISKQLCGVINTSTDVDIVKFTPTETGLYAVRIDATGGTICRLYDSSQNLLNSVTADSDKNYLFYNLEADKNYYLHFSGVNNNNYEFSAILPITLTKNIGSTNTISNNKNYEAYKFKPAMTGTYIITAVNSTNVTAELFDSSGAKIMSADLSDSMVSFRLTGNLSAEQDYYIVVCPKPGASLGAYTIYVEEPLALISIE